MFSVFPLVFLSVPPISGLISAHYSSALLVSLVLFPHFTLSSVASRNKWLKEGTGGNECVHDQRRRTLPVFCLRSTVSKRPHTWNRNTRNIILSCEENEYPGRAGQLHDHSTHYLNSRRTLCSWKCWLTSLWITLSSCSLTFHCNLNTEL